MRMKKIGDGITLMAWLQVVLERLGEEMKVVRYGE